MFEEEKKLLKSYASVLDLIGGFGRDAESSVKSLGINNIAGRRFLTPNFGKSSESSIPAKSRDHVKYVVYVSRSAWLFRLLRLAEQEIEAAEDPEKDQKTQEDKNFWSLSVRLRLENYESSQQIEQAIRRCVPDIMGNPPDRDFLAIFLLKSLDKKYNVTGCDDRYINQFMKFIEDVAFRLVVPEGSTRLEDFDPETSGLESNEKGSIVAATDGLGPTNGDEHSPSGQPEDQSNSKNDLDAVGINDDRSPLPPPNLSRGQTLIVLASSWHGVALVPVSPGESIQPGKYLLNQKCTDKDESENERAAECVAAFMWDELQRPKSGFPVATLVNEASASTTSDDSSTRKIFIVTESARAVIEIGVASRFFSHIVRPVGGRFDTNESTYHTQLTSRGVPAFQIGRSVLRTHLWFGVPLGLLITLWIIVGSAIIVYGASSVSLSQSSALPLGALGVVLVLTTMLSMLSFRLFVGVSFGSKRAFKGRMTRKTLKDQVETELDHSTMLRRLRAQLSARSVQFWTDLHQDHKVWNFAEDVVENRLGIRKAERHIMRALDNRIAASSDFKLDVVSYQRRHSRWLRIVFAGAVSAFVALEFMELITEWFGLHYGQSVYDLIGCVAQSDGSTDGGCSASSLAESLTESKNFRVSSILAVFTAIGAVVVGTVIALGRKLDDDE